MLVQITMDNVQQEIIAQSQEAPVIVLIYHSQDPEQTALTQKVTNFLENSTNHVALVDLNVPGLDALAYQFQLMALPAIAVVDHSRVTGIIQGDEVAAGYEKLLDPYLPKKDALLADEAQALLLQNQDNVALAKINEALELNNLAKYRLIKAEIFIKTNQLEEAKTLLDSLSMQEQLDEKDYYNTLCSSLELAQKTVDNSPIEDLKKQLENDPDNLDLKIEIALQFNQLNNKVEALNYLYQVLKQDLNYKDTKKTYLDILATMAASPVASKFKRMLYSLLY